MQQLQATPTAGHTALTRRDVTRWAVTFLGYPLAGFVALLVVGRVDSARPAVLGGLLSGAVLGAVQGWGLGRNRPPVAAWIVATAAGFAAGLGLGASLVNYHTNLAALVTQGAITGFATGSAQALVLLPFLRSAGYRFRPRFDFRHTGLGKTVRLAKWTLGFVLVTQLALVVVNRLASSATVGGSGAGLTAYLMRQAPAAATTVVEQLKGTVDGISVGLDTNPGDQ